MARRIIRGVRVATPRGIEPASVFIDEGRIVYVAGYEDTPREAQAEELGKSVLMPGLIATCESDAAGVRDDALMSGITTLTPGVTPGIAASEVSLFLSTRWTQMRERDQRIEMLVEELCTKAAQTSGLSESKGKIATGHDADLVIWNPEYTVTGTQPLLFGLIRQVIVAGRTQIEEGKRI
ncbi:MAG: amidohydrolase family protein [Myxococcales bacterium]|nr:amidohydrolase family protein [Myxococcales bacterium]